jgi:hypothetical protein
VGCTLVTRMILLRNFLIFLCHSIVCVELVRTLRARVEDRGSLISATCLSLPELHLGVVALGTFFVGDLLCAGNVLRDRKRSESVAFALEG